MNWTEQQVADYAAGRGKPVPAIERPKLPKPLYRSKTEAGYAEWLALMKQVGHIKDWAYEPVTLKLADGVRYTPDFMIVSLEGQIGFHEIKGRKDDKFWSRPVGKIKIKIAARLFPMWAFMVIWPSRRLGEWESMDISAPQETERA